MIPDAILSRIAKLLLILAAVLIFGVIYGIATNDRILLLLSISLAAAGGIKIAVLFLSARKREYVTIEGTVASLKRFPLQKSQTIILSDDTGNETELRVKGRAKLMAGCRYRLFLTQEDPLIEQLTQGASFLKPARTLLGFEQLDQDR